jgi:hypothetical protein
MRCFLLAAGVGFAALALPGCGGDQDARTMRRGGYGGQGGSSAGTGGSGTGGSGTGGGGRAGGAQMPPPPDAGAGDAGPATGEFTYPVGCPIPNPVGILGQKFAIQSFNFDTSEVVLKNISTTVQTIVGDRMGWQWCSVPSYWYIAPGNIVVPPGKTYKFILNLNTMGTWPLPPEGSELAIYVQSGTFDEPDKLVSFVSWGEGLQDRGREYVGVLATLWTQNSRIEIGSGDSGFIATGNVKLGSGYQGVAKRCLVAPPNP